MIAGLSVASAAHRAVPQQRGGKSKGKSQKAKIKNAGQSGFDLKADC